MEDLPALSPLHLSPGSRKLARMIALSLLLHVTVSALFLFRQQHRGVRPGVSYIDLKMLQPAAGPVQSAPAKIAPQTPESVPAAEASPPPPAPPSAYDNLQRKVEEAVKAGDVNDASFGLGMTSGYFSTLAEGKTLRPDIRDYYFSLLRQINEKWWLKKEGIRGSVGGAVIIIIIARDGTIVNLQLERSSGNRDWDTAMLQALHNASPLPPLPEGFRDDFFNAPLRFVAPLNLMLPGTGGA